MKKSILIILSCFFIFSNCSVNNSDSSQPKEVAYFWHLVHVTGGIAGIDEQFSMDTIVWSFDEETNILVVDNKNTDDNIEDSLDSGSYNFTVTDLDNTTYLIVAETELGSFEISNNTLIINQNFMSTGSGADGFIYTFQVEALVID